MDTIITNIALGLEVFFCWYFVGLGPGLALLPSHQKEGAFLLAPVIGLCLLVLVGLFEITILLIPLYSWLNIVVLLAVSMLLILWVCKNNTLVLQKKFFPLLVCPLLLLFIFSILFSAGYQLLVGSSDSLQYCLNSNQILEHMNRHTALDSPIPRHDHFVYEMATRTIPYLKGLRRGAEVILATQKSFTQLSFQEVFPVIVLNAFLSLGFALSFIGRFFLQFSIRGCIILQAVFLSSFYLSLLHIQGSLAMIVGMAPGLISLAFLSQLSEKTTLRNILLISILLSGYFSIYSEPAIFTILVPTLFLLMMSRYQSKSVFISTLRGLGCVILVATLLSPFAMLSVVSNVLGNVFVVGNTFLHTAITAHENTLSAWNVAAVILGAVSYYDNSAFNANLSIHIAKAPSLAMGAFILLSASAIGGLLRIKNKAGLLYAIALLCWSLSALLLSFTNDYLRFARSLHYAMPFVLIGLVALLQPSTSIKKQWGIVITGSLLLSVFVILNGYTDFRTFNYITAHNVSNDSIVLRLNENFPEWKSFNTELKSSIDKNLPILISGYTDTIRPLAIVSSAHNPPHVVGTSILKFWNIYNTGMFEEHRSRYNTPMTEEELQAALQSEQLYWGPHMELRLIKRSLQAVVAVGSGYPSEWTDKDVYAPLLKRFPNIGDVIYRYQYSVTLPEKIVTALQKDNKGSYRWIRFSGPLIVKEITTTTQHLTLDYDGPVSALKIQMGNKLISGHMIHGRMVRIGVNVSPKDQNNIKILLTHAVKLRAMMWEPISIEG